MLGESRLYRLVRQFAVNTPIWGTAIRYEVLPDEQWDLTLVSKRVYGTRDEFLTIMAAAGLNRLDDKLPQIELVLPTADQLAALKVQAGYTDSNGNLTGN
jgi:hypothetical protein